MPEPVLYPLELSWHSLCCAAPSPASSSVATGGAPVAAAPCDDCQVPIDVDFADLKSPAEVVVKDVQLVGVQPSAEASRHPLKVAGYEILGELGRGGMGVVYQARQPGVKRVVALKVMLDGGHASPEDRARFRTEIETIGSLHHPNIVQIYEVGEEEGRPYFSMEYLPGGSLAQRIRAAQLGDFAVGAAGLGKIDRSAPKLDIESAARLVETLARAMACVHDLRVVHRDLKPANILLAADGTPKITDFGLAKRLHGPQGHTRSKVILGTPSYIGPEQAEGKLREIGPATDVYALGAILYELLTGQPPHRADTPVDTLLEVLFEEPTPPRSLTPEVPADLETICLKCLQKDAQRRYPNAAALAADLRRYLDRAPIVARPAAPHAEPSRTSGRLWSTFALAACVLLLCGTTVLGLRGRFASPGSDVQSESPAPAAPLSAADSAAIPSLPLRVTSNFRQACESVEQLVRRGLFEDAARIYQGFLEANADVPGLRLEIGQIQLRLGDLRQRLGNYEAAESHYDRAEATLRAPLGAEPNDRTRSRDWARTMLHRGLLRHRLGRSQAGMQDSELAEEMLRHLHDTASDAEGFACDHARAMNNIGTLFQSDRRHGLAEAAYTAAIDRWEKLLERRPTEPDYQFEQAVARCNLGTLLQATGRRDEAAKAYRRAQSFLRVLADDYAGVPDYRHALATSHFYLGALTQAQDDSEEAERQYRQAVALLTPLAAELPGVPEYRHTLARCQLNLGAVLQMRDRLADARSAYTTALALLDRLSTDHPANPEYREDAAAARENLAALSERLELAGSK